MEALLLLAVAVAGLAIPLLVLKGSFRGRLDKPGVLGCACVVVFVHLIYVNVRPSSVLPQIVAQCMRAGVLALKGDTAQLGVFHSYHETDEAFSSYSGNVVMRFAGFDETRLRDKDFLEFTYFRGVYALYPRRVYVGAGHQAINTAGDILSAGLDPDEKWMEEHRVGTVVSYRVDANGDLGHEVKRREGGGGNQ